MLAKKAEPHNMTTEDPAANEQFKRASAAARALGNRGESPYEALPGKP